MDTLTKLQTIRYFNEWAAENKIDASPLALLEYLDQNTKAEKQPAAAPTPKINDPHKATYEVPGRPGYTVFVIDGDEILRMEINYFSIYRYNNVAHLIDSHVLTKRKIVVNIKAFGKTVFFTKPEAERALAKRATPKPKPAEVAKNCHTCKWRFAPVEQTNCYGCVAHDLWEA